MTRTFFAPGRVNLIGEHTDYSGGLVLPAALDLGVRIEGEASDRIRLESEQVPGVVDLDARGEPGEGWGRFAGAVAVELHALGRPPVGFTGRVSSDVPAGAGLSSSAALEVAIATALCAVADFALEPLALAQAAQRAEHRAVGMPCGIMDQAASVLGEADHAILLDTGTLEHRTVPLPPELALVIVDSGVRHVLAESGYKDRRRELEQALAAVGELDPVLRRRLRHVRTENERVCEVVAALEAGDTAALGPLFRAGHVSLRDDYEVSTPELDLLVERAYALGAVAARMTGGGFGGSIVVLAESARAEELAATIAEAVDGAHGFVTRAGAGARELS
jgi:galactokinase